MIEREQCLNFTKQKKTKKKTQNTKLHYTRNTLARMYIHVHIIFRVYLVICVHGTACWGNAESFCGDSRDRNVFARDVIKSAQN